MFPKLRIGFSGSVLFTIVLTLSACQNPATNSLTQITPRMREVHGEDRLNVILHPDRVESFRIEPVLTKGDGLINGHKIVAKGPLLNPKQILVMQRALTRLESFAPGHSKWCGGIRPGVAIRFHRGEQKFTALLCFKCEEWQLIDGEAEFHEMMRTNFDGAQRALASLVKQLFPHDEEIQSIEPSDKVGRAYGFTPNMLEYVNSHGERTIVHTGDQLVEYMSDHIGQQADWDTYGGDLYQTWALDDRVLIYSTDAGHNTVANVPGIRVIP